MNGIQNSIMTSTNSLDERSLYLRRQVMKGLASTEKGHVGSALPLIEITRVWYGDILRVNLRQPDSRKGILISLVSGMVASHCMQYLRTSHFSLRMRYPVLCKWIRAWVGAPSRQCQE